MYCTYINLATYTVQFLRIYIMYIHFICLYIRKDKKKILYLMKWVNIGISAKPKIRVKFRDPQSLNSEQLNRSLLRTNLYSQIV